MEILDRINNMKVGDTERLGLIDLKKEMCDGLETIVFSSSVTINSGLDRSDSVQKSQLRLIADNITKEKLHRTIEALKESTINRVKNYFDAVTEFYLS